MTHTNQIHEPLLCMYVYVCVWCMCVFGGLSSFYIWMEGLCVVGWGGGGGGGGVAGGSFSSSFIASMLYIRFSCIPNTEHKPL